MMDLTFKNIVTLCKLCHIYSEMFLSSEKQLQQNFINKVLIVETSEIIVYTLLIYFLEVT